MKSTVPTRRYGRGSAVYWVGAGALSLGSLFSSSAAFAVAPPAQTNIGNTASASFTDATGKASIVTSNPVVTVVQQVGAFALDGVTGITTTVINTKASTAGGTVYAPHVLTNTGNGPDSFNISVASANGRFSRIEIFADDGGGNPSGAALCSALVGVACNIAAPTTITGSNGTFKFVVAYTVPASATTPVAPYETATLTVAPIAASASMYSVASTVAKDAVNLSSGAAFTMGKSIGAPQVAAAGNGTWPTVAVGGKASTSTSCSTSWSAGLNSTAVCQYTVYTLTFSNTGTAPGRFAMADTLPSGLTYVTGSAVWSSASGTALTETALNDPAGIDFKVTGSKLVAVVNSVAAGNTQTLSFVVLVNPSAVAGAARTTNIAYYNPGDAGTTATSDLPGELITPTGTTPYVVYGSYGVVLGSLNSTSSNALDTSPGVPNASPADVTSVSSAVSGAMVKFEQKVYNTGDTIDTVNLTINPGTFPEGTNFYMFGSDGATPLYDTGVLDGVQDTGPIPPNGQTTVVIAAFLPVGLPIGPVNYSAVVTGTSRNDPGKKDATRDSITGISRGLVDLTNTPSGNGTAGSTGNGDTGPGPSPSPTTVNITTAGVATAFNLYVSNNDSIAHSYTLAASASPSFPGNLPANWTVKFLLGADVPCSPTSVGVSATGPIASGGQAPVTACITPGAQQTPVTASKIYFKVLATSASSSGVVAADTKTDAVTVNASAVERFAASLVGSNTGELASPGTVVYSHILSNIGLENCGAYTLQVAFSAAEVAAGWTSAIYLDKDGNGQIGAGDSLVTAPISEGLLTGASNAQRILVRIGAPGGLPAGSFSSAAVSAVFAGPNSCGAPSVTDRTTITSGSVRVYKSQAIDAACDGSADGVLGTANLAVKPGNCIYYHVTAVNEGSSAVSNLTINDRAPAFTTLSSKQPTNKCTTTSVGGIAPVFASVGADVSCGSTSSVLSPGGSVSLDYTVIIDN